METDTVRIDLIVPQGWHELTQGQLRFVFRLIAAELSSDELMTTCLLEWSGIKIVGRQPNRSYLASKGKLLFEVTAASLAELLPQIRWLAELPTVPVRLEKIDGAAALAADFQGVPFKTFIVCDNLYQGYLHTQKDEMLDELGTVLYGRRLELSAPERISVFYWMAALKQYFSHRFPDFFQPAAGAQEGNLLGAPNIGAQLQEAMDAQIRALTKGDITKEGEILALDTWRALTELNAQAREYRHIQAQMRK